MKKYVEILLILLVFFNTTASQSIGETIAESTILETGEDGLEEEWEYFKKRRLDINEVTAQELRIFRLTELQISSFVHYRRMVGNFIDLTELQAVPGWNPELVRRLLPYLSIGEKSLHKSVKERIRHGEGMYLLRWSLPVEEAKGFREDHYAGSRSKLLFRYKFRHKNLLQYGLTLEKDAGEKLMSRRGPDFSSIHLFVRDAGIIKALAVGDFTVSMGQGLMQWNGRGSGMGADVINISRQQDVLMPYTSTGETGFQRGIGITLERKNWRATLFGASNKWSANPGFDSLEQTATITSLSRAGLHRTVTEIQNRNQVGVVSAGSSLGYHGRSFHLSVNGIAYILSKPIQKKEEPYSSLEGSRFMNLGIDYAYTYRNLHFFGEVTAGRSRDVAGAAGMLISLDRRADLSILYRRIPPAYQAFLADAFTTSAYVNNESGMYCGISLRPSGSIQLNLYADLFEHVFLRYRVNGPSRGSGFLVQATYQPGKKTQVYARFRVGAEEENGQGRENGIHPLAPVMRKSWKLHYIYVFPRDLRVQGRVEGSWYRKGNITEDGFLWFIEPAFAVMNKWKMHVRVLAFETGGFNSRIYTYESDVLYSSQLPFFYDSGYRYYITCRREILKDLDLSLKWSQTWYRDKNELGEGWDQIRGNRRSELRLQLVYMPER